MAVAGFSPVQRVVEVFVDLAQRPEAAPVLIRRDAFDAFSPNRDTVVAPGSLIGLGEHLVEAGALVNGASIRRLPATGLARYVQIEMGRHDMVIADGVRVATAHAGDAPCRPLLGQGAALEALRARLLARVPLLEAGWRGPRASSG